MASYDEAVTLDHQEWLAVAKALATVQFLFETAPDEAWDPISGAFLGDIVNKIEGQVTL